MESLTKLSSSENVVALIEARITQKTFFEFRYKVVWLEIFFCLVKMKVIPIHKKGLRSKLGTYLSESKEQLLLVPMLYFSPFS